MHSYQQEQKKKQAQKKEAKPDGEKSDKATEESKPDKGEITEAPVAAGAEADEAEGGKSLEKFKMSIVLYVVTVKKQFSNCL